MLNPFKTCAICGKPLKSSPYRRYRDRCDCAYDIYIFAEPKAATYT